MWMYHILDSQAVMRRQLASPTLVLYALCHSLQHTLSYPSLAALAQVSAALAGSSTVPNDS